MICSSLLLSVSQEAAEASLGLLSLSSLLSHSMQSQPVLQISSEVVEGYDGLWAEWDLYHTGSGQWGGSVGVASLEEACLLDS